MTSLDTTRILAEFLRWPSIVTWERMEGRPRSDDFSRALAAEVRDAMWMLSRQWQTGEFEAEDGGTAVDARVASRAVRINRYAARGRPAVAYDDDLPLELVVERELAPFDLWSRAQAGRHFRRLAVDRGAVDIDTVIDLHVARYGFSIATDPADQLELDTQPGAAMLLRVLVDRAIDGRELLDAIASGDHAAVVAESGLSTPDRTAALNAAADLARWHRGRFSEPADAGEDAWSPAHLEYQFALAADRADGGQIVLAADEYHGGRLDWYTFDVEEPDERLPDADGVNGVLQLEPPAARPVEEFVPTPIEFGGMPNPRWWEFEDRRTDFGGVTPATTDVGTLLVTELMMGYGNDWSVLPIDVEVGSLVEVTGVVVTDTFGRRTLVEPAGTAAGSEWQRWSMFDLTARSGFDRRLFVAPALASSHDGDPIERVIFTRDEMANLVWAIEDRVPGVVGSGVDGHELARLVAEQLADGELEPTSADVDASIRYVLGTTVPGNWIPFVPVRLVGSDREIGLRRAAMPRLETVDPADVVGARAVILHPSLPPGEPFVVNEEEIPRAGAIVTRGFQRTRTRSGASPIWLGRQRRTGRGGASSGLNFDIIADPHEPSAE